MRYRVLARLIATGGLGIGLSGCALWQAATFRSHPDSFVKGKQMTVMIGPVANIPPEQRDWCAVGTPGALVFGPSTAPLVTSILSLVLGLGSDEAAAYVAAKEKEFSRSFTKTSNIDQLFVKNSGTITLAAQCVVVQIAANDGGGTDDFDFAALIIGSGADTKPAAYRLMPTFYRLNRSAARTGTDGKVDVVVEVAFTAVDGISSNHVIEANNAAIDAKVALSGILLPKAGETAAQHRPVDDPTNLGAKNATPPFAFRTGSLVGDCQADPSCTGIVPASITLTLTQTGTGSPDYGTAKTEITDATKAISQGFSDLTKANTAK